MFGQLVKKIRAELRLGLREFCEQVRCDPSNWSKIERELMPPPQDHDLLTRVAKALKLKEQSERWNDIFDYAATDAGRIPQYLLEDKALTAKLPVFFRTVSGKKPNRAELEKLARLLREE